MIEGNLNEFFLTALSLSFAIQMYSFEHLKST